MKTVSEKETFVQTAYSKLECIIGPFKKVYLVFVTNNDVSTVARDIIGNDYSTKSNLYYYIVDGVSFINNNVYVWGISNRMHKMWSE